MGKAASRNSNAYRSNSLAASRINSLLFSLLLLCLHAYSHGHAVGENYIFLDIRQDRLDGRLQIHERELTEKFGMELEATAPPVKGLAEVLDYVRDNFSIAVGTVPLRLEYVSTELLELPQGRFLQLGFTAPWPGELPQELEIRQELFFELDKRHRGLVLIHYNAHTDETAEWENTALIFSPDKPLQNLDLVDVPGLSGRLDFLLQGTWHILIGFDHILFLLTLLLTAVVFWSGKSWQPVAGFKQSLWNVAAIVTVFTVAHSITLTVAALGWVSLPSKLVESVIALSILVMALHNLRPFLRHKWLVIFAFGLFHGLGFASVMEHLSFRMVELVSVMVLFNIGVEMGQLLLVAIIFPLLFLMRERSWYGPFVLRGGSVLIALKASYWLIERGFG
jgi:hypothetical protein